MDDVNIRKEINMQAKDITNILKKIGKILIIILFILGSILVAKQHEHWSDEAQSFLLARDNSLLDLFSAMKYEGTPPLWVLIIKLFIFVGGNYDTFYIIPIIFSTIGLVIFEFKIKVPWLIKVIFPFTYFIFYQYTIVARSYCIVFPLLMLIISIYEKRFEKPILFAIILFFFMNISLHTLVISGSLYLIFLIDLFKRKSFKEQKIILACVLIFVELLLVCLCAIPAKDCSFVPRKGENIVHVIIEATIGSNLNKIFEFITIIIIFLICMFNLERNQIIDFLILILPVTMVLVFITFQNWHIGIIWLIIFSGFIINKSINNKIFIKVLSLIVCLTQLYWTICSINYDINNNYSASKDVAIFLKENNYARKNIYGLGYSVTAIQPYFDYNIFKNQNTDKSFYLWKKNNGYMDLEEIINNKADIYIISKFYQNSYYKVIDELEKKDYKKYEFNGYTYIKDNIYESEGYIVYIK